MDSFWISFICWALIVLGTLGSVLPFLPGLPVAWVGLLVYAWYGHFQSISFWPLLIFAILIGLTIVVDVISPAIAASGKRASKYGIWGSMMGGLFGVILVGPIGILLGPFVGAFVGEMLNARDTKNALDIAWASMFGLVIGSAFKLLVGTSMFIYFLIKMI